MCPGRKLLNDCKKENKELNESLDRCIDYVHEEALELNESIDRIRKYRKE